MSTIVFCWELGAGLGHLASFAPFAKTLRNRGHEVVLVVRNPAAVPIVLGEGWTAARAPIMKEPPRQRFAPTSNYVRLLWNSAWGDTAGLTDRLQQWKRIFTSISPQLVIADHAPTALLAARSLSFRKIMLGAPFCCPEPLSSFSDVYAEGGADELARDKRQVLDAVNRALEGLGESSVERLEEIFEVDSVYLTSFPELDPFERKRLPCFTGSYPISEGVRGEWPQGSGRVFVYLKEGPEVGLVVQALSHLRIAGLVFTGHRTLKNVSVGETVKLFEKPIALDAAAEECDMAITNATHGTTACLLAAGKPMLMFPRYVEQHLTARRVISLGAGLTGGALSPRAVGESILRLLRDSGYAERAREMADRSRTFLSRERFLNAVAQIEQIAEG